MLRRAYIWVPLIIAGLGASACGSNTSAAGPGGGGGGRGRGGRGGDGGAAPVVAAKVTERDVPVDLAAIGNVEAYATVSLRSQVTGQLQEIEFREGDIVKSGQVLFKLDPRPFEATLAQAEANLLRDKALLAQAEAQLARDAANAEYQQITSERQAQLVQRGIISKDAAEQVRASADATRAVVNADKANIESVRAQSVSDTAVVENAKVSLGYCVIRSPIDGRTGSLEVKVGSLITANTLEMITVSRIEPVLVTFSVPAMHLSTIKQHMAGGHLPVTATPQDANAEPAEGTLSFIDSAVDMTTDTIKLKGTFTNTDRRLWPGQFARVSLRLTTLPNATVVPAQAVQTGQDGQYVFVVKDDSTVEQRTITAGQRVADDVVVEKGLRVGETVVTEGQLRLEPGTRVTTDLSGRGAGGGRGRGGRGSGGQTGAGGQGRGPR